MIILAYLKTFCHFPKDFAMSCWKKVCHFTIGKKFMFDGWICSLPRNFSESPSTQIKPEIFDWNWINFRTLWPVWEQFSSEPIKVSNQTKKYGKKFPNTSNIKKSLFSAIGHPPSVILNVIIRTYGLYIQSYSRNVFLYVISLRTQIILMCLMCLSPHIFVMSLRQYRD